MKRRLLKITATIWPKQSNDCREVPPFLVDAEQHNIPADSDSNDTLSRLVSGIINPLGLGGLVGYSVEELTAEQLQVKPPDPWGRYGAPAIWDKVLEREDYYPVGYDEDGGQTYRTVRYFGLTASNDAYIWEANFNIREEAEAELSLALADPTRLAAEDSLWGRRTPYGSPGWGAEDEWEMMTDEERSRVGTAFWSYWGWR